MKIAVVSSFPPSKNGIAEFNQDLITALQTHPNVTVIGVAINESDQEKKNYSSMVRLQIVKDKQSDYKQAADRLNSMDIDVVILQHEFYQFGGYQGNYILDFISSLTVPLVSISHTIPIRSDAHKKTSRKNFFLNSNKYVKTYITLLEDGRQKLIQYGISPKKVITIPHPVPTIQQNNTDKIRNMLNLPDDHLLLLSFGIFHPNKGTLYTLEAMQGIKAKKHKAHLVILGSIMNTESEKYYQKLHSYIQSHNLSDYITLINKYLHTKELFEYIGACDVGIVPYIYRSYTASGPLSFFIGAAKPIISTRFAYASYIFQNQKANIFVPFKNANAISNSIERLIADTALRASLNSGAKSLREELTWSRLSQKYLDICKNVSNT